MNKVGDLGTGPDQAGRNPQFLSGWAIIARNLALKSISEFAARGIQFAFVIVLARRLGAQEFGAYSIATALGFVMAQVSDLGLQLHLAVELARASGRRAQILGAALWCKLILFSAALLCLLACLRIQTGVEEWDVFFLLALSVMLTSGLEFLNYAFRGFQRLEFEAGLNLTSRILGPGIAIPCLLLGASLRVVAWNLLLANTAAAVLGYHWLTRYFTHPDWRVSLSEGWRALTRVLPLGIAIALSALHTRIGILLLTRLTSLDQAGWFNAAQRLAEPFQLLPAIALAAIFPAFAARRDVLQQSRLARRTLLGLFGLSLPLAICGCVGAGPIIDVVYGSGYRPSASSLRWLAPALVPMFLNYALTHFFIARGRAWLNVLFTSVITTENLGLSLWLVPTLGAPGAAIALLASEVTLLGLCFLGFWRAMRRSTVWMVPAPFGTCEPRESG